MSVVPLPEVEGGGPPRAAPRHMRRWIMLALALAVLLGVLLPPYVNLKRFRTRLEGSIGGALGRKVTVGGASLRLLPRPGFNLDDLVVYDDPSISAEPMIRAASVTASLRLASLWRGRLEIASLTLQYPSLNLVRAADGRWNVEALVARASQVPTAPTTQPRADSRPRFPYIEAEGGRINFKIGQEKKAFALTDADFSVWLAQEDEWNMRLNARPVRTDFNLSDTGRIRLSGSFRRAASFRETPVTLHATLERAQLGQLTTLVYRRDRGWRGTANVTADLAGTPAALQLAVDAAVDDFRRYDIMTGGSFSLRSRCVASYSVDSGNLTGIQCMLPAGDGEIAVRGQVAGVFQERAYDLSISARDVPMQQLVLFAQHAKRDLPGDLGAAGTVDAAFVVRTVPQDPKVPQTWSGGGNTRGFVLHSQTLGADLALGELRFVIQPGQMAGAARKQPDFQHLQLVVPEFDVDLGSAAPAVAKAVITRSQYSVKVQGDADLARLLGVARGLGLAAPQRVMTGAARVDVTIAGAWAGFAAPLAIGNVQLKNATADLPGVTQPVHVSSAVVSLANDGISITDIAAGFTGSRVLVEGAASFPRRCDFSAACAVEFDLHTDQISTDELNRLLNPQLRKTPWYSFVSSDASADARALARMHAQGRISIGRLQLKSASATHVSADLKLADGHAVFNDLRGEILGGKHQGRWEADFTDAGPAYTGSGTLEAVALPQVSAAMHDNWAAGTLNATYHASLTGKNAAELFESLSGSLDFQWHDGTLRHLLLRGTEPLRFQRFRGHAVFKDGKLTFSESSMEAAPGIYQVSGTVSLARDMELRLTPRTGPPIQVGGSLQKPRISAERAAQAELKP